MGWYVIEPPFSLWDRSGSPTDAEPVADGFRYASDTNDEWLDLEQMRLLLEDL